MDRERLIKEIEMRDAAALKAFEEAKSNGGPSEVYFLQGRWLALRELLEDIKRGRC